MLGLLMLVVLLVAYLIGAERTQRPLSVFAVPPLIVVNSSWRVTLGIGTLAIVTALIVGLSGPLDGLALAVRWATIFVAVVAGTLGAWVRGRHTDELLRLRDVPFTMCSRPAWRPILTHRRATRCGSASCRASST